MMYLSLLALLEKKPKNHIVIYVPEMSETLNTMLIEGELDLELLFEMGDIVVLTKDGYMNSNKEIVESPNPFDLVEYINFIDSDNATFFYKQPQLN